MSALSTDAVSHTLRQADARVFEIETHRDGSGIVSAGYYATR
jgi:hypothetical protein